MACEIAAEHVAVAAWSGGRLGLEGFALERVSAGRVLVAPVLPNQVVRVFILHFETFPRRADEAEPLLRWRLKKSVPFDVEEAVVSYMTQESREAGVDV